MTSYRINNLLDPSSTQDAATKSYVDTKTNDMATNASVASVATAASNAQSTANSATSAAAAAQTTANSAVTAAAAAQTKANTLATATTQGTATAGAQYLYPLNDNPAGILTNGAWRMYVMPTGNIGIGTTTPTYPLHVNGTGVSASTTGGYIDSGGATKAGTDNRLVVAGFQGGWVAGNIGFIIFSDQRIKSDIINVDIQSNLELFRKIRPVKHGYIDKLEYGNFNKYGFIAQEIQQIIPEAVVEGTQVIPSVYCNANIVNTQNNFLLRFEKPLKNIQQFKIGIKLKCYYTKNEIVWVTIKEIIDSQNIEIEENITNDKLFVYGHSVDDFLQIEKDAIWTVATAALQEVDRQQQADKVRIAELEATVANQQSLINDILERLKTVEKA
jgi:hypothetical protein